MTMLRLFAAVLTALLPLGFLAVMVVAPLIALALYDGGGIAWSVLNDDYMQQRVWWTIIQAAATCGITLLLGVPAAWTLARLDFFGRRTLLRLLMLPFVMPTLVAAMGVLALFGANGMLWAGWQDTPYLLLYGNVFFNLPVLIRAAYQGLLCVPEARLQTAQTLGAGAWQRFWLVEWPVLKPWLAGGACLVFLYCFSGFGLALLLGGSRYATVEVEIYQLIAYELDIAQASVLVWLMLAVTAAAGLLYAWLSRRTAVGKTMRPPQPRTPQSGGERLLLAGTCTVLLFCCALPLAAIWVQALAAGSAWQVWAETDTLAAAWNTLRFSTLAVLSAVVLGVMYAMAARRAPWIRALTFLPFMVSPVCVAFGVLLLYPEWTASLPLLIATYALLAYPFVAKDISAAWDGLSANYAAAAASMGAGRLQTAWYVTVPLLKPALRRGMTLAAATCIGEFAATLFLSRPEWQTLTTLVYHYLSRAGADNYARAMVLTAILLTLALLVFLLLDEKETEKAV
ncbi:ABC transporter permease [Neisseria animalis]|uniref:Iron ABC transporter permease n=1 Tax=Neisseria animalis TaxID=492 RepID=A0A5P3MQX6_NEIAN|nr:iron ABC transporter permease [Neisseria animalis]QEY24002.1 iron ABC transporter permease [Neisseria animalis]ROW32695.1 iron ABC transporter permease [Neisseria animalis]VEE06048.1 putative transporter [Neisseria animalis]